MASTRRKAAYTAAAAAVAADGPAGFGSRVASIPRLVRDVLAGDYDGMTRGRLAMMVLALLYIVSPIDLLPEALMTIPVWLTTPPWRLGWSLPRSAPPPPTGHGRTTRAPPTSR